MSILNSIAIFLLLSIFGYSYCAYDPLVVQSPTIPRTCCDSDMVVTECFRTCTENTCENFLKPRNYCSTICQPDTCVCKPGLCCNDCNQCVTPHKCTLPCQNEPNLPLECTGQFEKMYSCLDPVESKVCPELRFSKPLDIFFVLKQVPRPSCQLNTCDCIDGYFRNKCGLCVPVHECGQRSCVKTFTPCSGPNEVRVRKYRKCTARTCANLKHPMTCEGKAGKINETICDCTIGYRRNKCGRCVPDRQCYRNDPCVCSDPCAPNPFGLEWQCFNPCNFPYCYNIYLLPNKTCEKECMYGCVCSREQDLWWNGTVCVKSYHCPSRDASYFQVPVGHQHTNQLFTSNIGADYAIFNDQLPYLNSFFETTTQSTVVNNNINVNSGGNSTSMSSGNNSTNVNSGKK